MKMKKACEATALTERAIRLYVSKGLITPRQRDGLIDFSPEDIRLLQDIALLRQLDFSIEQIAGMIGKAQDIPAIIAARMDAARVGADHEDEVSAALSGLEEAEMGSLHALADSVRACSVIPSLNFAQFDEISAEERQQERSAAIREVDRQQKRQRLMHHLGWTALVIAVAAVIAAVFLSQTRIDGYIAVAPVTVVSVQGERATFLIGNEEAVAVLGRDTITVPYTKDGFQAEQLDVWGRPTISAGDVVDMGCQLAVKLTNYDLLRLGISPLQDFTPRSVQRHNEWITLILHAMFDDGESDNASLWIRYPADVRPLLWQAE